MFTGIIQGVGYLVKIQNKINYKTYLVKIPNYLSNNLNVGSSISCNGCCLTITNIEKNIITLDLIQETIKVTNLDKLIVNDEINIERSVKLNDEIGGHLMSGHIFCTATISKIISLNEYKTIWFVPNNINAMKYIFYKGYIGIDGISLTIGEVLSNKFCINFICETIKKTTINKKQVGDKVNIEIDNKTQLIVDTVEKFLNEKLILSNK